jgi:hypothetical protein
MTTARTVSLSSGTSEPIFTSGPIHQTSTATTSRASSVSSSGLNRKPKIFLIISRLLERERPWQRA